MARTNVHFESKKQELAQAIWHMLITCDYEAMTVSAITEKLGISKGAFYHYFVSKEACVDEAVSFYAASAIASLQEQDEPDEAPALRLSRAIKSGIAFFHESTDDRAFIHRPENTVFHQKLMAATVRSLAPFYASLVQVGVETGDFHTPFPLETAEMILTLANFYLDPAVFHWDTNELEQKTRAVEYLTNKALGASAPLHLFPTE